MRGRSKQILLACAGLSVPQTQQAEVQRSHYMNAYTPLSDIPNQRVSELARSSLSARECGSRSRAQGQAIGSHCKLDWRKAAQCSVEFDNPPVWHNISLFDNNAAILDDPPNIDCHVTIHSIWQSCQLRLSRPLSGTWAESSMSVVNIMSRFEPYGRRNGNFQSVKLVGMFDTANIDKV